MFTFFFYFFNAAIYLSLFQSHCSHEKKIKYEYLILAINYMIVASLALQHKM
jgi:hypothetical protein